MPTRAGPADSEIVFAVQESPEGGYEARALSHAIFTQAETVEELKAAAQDVVRFHPPRRASRPRMVPPGASL